jgi:hypothetical protein
MEAMSDFSSQIFHISPVSSPLFETRKWAVMKLSQPGGSMRKQRRRKAKPLRVSLASRARRIVHEWILVKPEQQ